jgi:short-subunit dehydrogenase involved in D-alanine esterification of teichoic acids
LAVVVQSERALVEWATSRFKTLNVPVNNAGIQRDIDFTRSIAQCLADACEEYFAGAS